MIFFSNFPLFTSVSQPGSFAWIGFNLCLLAEMGVDGELATGVPEDWPELLSPSVFPSFAFPSSVVVWP